MKKSKRVKKIKKVFYNIFMLIMPIMLGVYFGLLANNWNEGRKQNELTQKMLSSLVQEVIHNQRTVEESIAYFYELRDSIYYSNDKDSINPAKFSFWKGLNPPLLKSASFESATISGTLTNIDLDLLEQLSTTYNQQEDLKNQTETYLFSVINKIGTKELSNRMYMIILENYSHDQISAEEALLKELEQTKSLLLHKIVDE